MAGSNEGSPLNAGTSTADACVRRQVRDVHGEVRATHAGGDDVCGLRICPVAQRMICIRCEIYLNMFNLSKRLGQDAPKRAAPCTCAGNAPQTAVSITGQHRWCDEHVEKQT